VLTFADDVEPAAARALGVLGSIAALGSVTDDIRREAGGGEQADPSEDGSQVGAPVGRSRGEEEHHEADERGADVRREHHVRVSRRGSLTLDARRLIRWL
jgi:hypothetical protein